MKKADVQIGAVYTVKVSGKLVPVRLDSESVYGGWQGTNLDTGRSVHIRTAAKLRRPYQPRLPDTPVSKILRPADLYQGSSAPA